MRQTSLGVYIVLFGFTFRKNSFHDNLYFNRFVFILHLSAARYIEHRLAVGGKVNILDRRRPVTAAAPPVVNQHGIAVFIDREARVPRTRFGRVHCGT